MHIVGKFFPSFDLFHIVLAKNFAVKFRRKILMEKKEGHIAGQRRPKNGKGKLQNIVDRSTAEYWKGGQQNTRQENNIL